MSKTSAVLRLLAGIGVAVFVALPLTAGSIGLAVDLARGWRPPVHDPTLVPTLVGLGVAVPLSIFGAWKLIASGRRGLPQSAPRPPFWASLAERYPRMFARAFTLNGFGLRYLDFHDRGDGTWAATLWVTAAFFPIAPVRCERMSAGGRTEPLALPRERTRRVYLFYYAVFLPLVVLPVAGGLALVITYGGHVTALLFWTVASAILAWGIGVVAFERRLMGRPKAV